MVPTSAQGYQRYPYLPLRLVLGFNRTRLFIVLGPTAREFRTFKDVDSRS